MVEFVEDCASVPVEKMLIISYVKPTLSDSYGLPSSDSACWNLFPGSLTVEFLIPLKKELKLNKILDPKIILHKETYKNSSINPS